MRFELNAWLPARSTEVSYCPECDEIYISGLYRALYCKGTIVLGLVEETYTEVLERELDTVYYKLELALKGINK